MEWCLRQGIQRVVPQYTDKEVREKAEQRFEMKRESPLECILEMGQP
jgi:hypothetical protein